MRDSPRPHGDFHKGTTTMGCQKAIPTKLLFFVLICSATIAFPQTRQSFFNFFFRLRLGVFFLGRRQRPLASARSGRSGGKGGGGDFDANVRRVFFRSKEIRNQRGRKWLFFRRGAPPSLPPPPQFSPHFSGEGTHRQAARKVGPSVGLRRFPLPFSRDSAAGGDSSPQRQDWGELVVNAA